MRNVAPEPTRRSIGSVLLLLAMFAGTPASALDNGDPFPPTWRANIAAWAGGYAITRAPAPDGRPAIRFELRAGDCTDNTIDDCATYRERTELRSLVEPPIGAERWYRYAMFIPADYPGIGLDEIVGQFHDGSKPVLSNRLKDGTMKFVVQRVSGSNVAVGSLPAQYLRRGEWTEFTYHARWSAGADGFMRVLVGGTEVFTYIGPNVDATQMTDPYLKIGIYRSHLDNYTGGSTPTAVLYYTDVATGTAGPLYAAVLPSARSVPVGATASAFATMINASGAALSGCRMALTDGTPGAFTYQATDASNLPVGLPGTPVPVAAGAAQGFVFQIAPSAPIIDRHVAPEFLCNGAVPASSQRGLSTLLLSSGPTSAPDMVAIGATITGDGIVHAPASPGVTAFAVATINNAGVSGSITASVDDGGAGLPVTAAICRTDPATGICLAGAQPSPTTALIPVAAGEVQTFTVFVAASGAVPFAPADRRLFVRFRTGDGVTRGATSVAVCAPAGIAPCH